MDDYFIERESESDGSMKVQGCSKGGDATSKANNSETRILDIARHTWRCDDE